MAGNEFRPWQPGLWRFTFPRMSRGVVAGITDRSCDMEGLRARLAAPAGVAFAAQPHGASVAALEVPSAPADPLPGCDGLTTRTAGLALVIRSADCLPIVLWDPIQRAVGLLHAGWRGLADQLPLRALSFLRHGYHSNPAHLWVGIGPAIRPCCYEVGREFLPRFGRFVSMRRGRRVCDLIGYATQQLLAGGVPRTQVVDSGRCTACEPARWHSVRREGERGGRLFSFAMIRPEPLRRR